ncbi:hypothetical protein L1987_65164 [Smallanthus sonchifolius]|uniref:Uncharacterized protein n=1 Tax=Smallanthus sonchifolius TaxID=185202 RepID=A0ACB9BTR5_9ASTR|nr:hypothetical protein L1987_65164 [Smallanthus sonchifolius]
MIVVRTSSEVFCARGLLENHNQKKSFRGSRLVQCTGSTSSTADDDDFKPQSTARCRIYRRKTIKNDVKETLFHRLIGPTQQLVDDIHRLASHNYQFDVKKRSLAVRLAGALAALSKESKGDYDGLSDLIRILRFATVTEGAKAGSGFTVVLVNAQPPSRRQRSQLGGMAEWLKALVC